MNTRQHVSIRDIILDQHKIAERIVELSSLRQPELYKRIGRSGYEHCIQDIKYTFAFLKLGIEAKDYTIIFSYIKWLKVLMINYQMTQDHLIDNFRSMKDVLRSEYNDQLDEEVIEVINEIIEFLPGAELEEVHKQEINSKYGQICKKYLTYLLKLEKHNAYDYIMGLYYQDKMTVQELYLEVFQPALREVGKLWHYNKITVAQEHYCTAATQWIMTRLYPDIFKDTEKRNTFIGMSISGELHEVGIRMVSDFLELEGWDTHYLGANMPIPAIIKMITEKQPIVIGISATMTFHVETVKQVIQMIKAHPQCQNIKIVVGGYIFNQSKELWQYVGADGYGEDARATCELVNKWLQ